MDREEPYTDYELMRMREADEQLEVCLGCGLMKDTHEVSGKRLCMDCIKYLHKVLTTKTMIAKIEASSFTGKTFQSKYGLMYVHSVTINGEVGSANAKTQMPEHFKVGTTVEVERTEDEFGVKFKISKPKEQQGGNQSSGKSPETQLQINRQNALNRAFDFYANGWQQTGGKPSPQDLMNLAEEFTAWIMK